MAMSEIGLSMLYCLGAPFKKMIEEIPKVQASYIEIIDDGLHTLDKKKTVKLNEIGKSHGIKYTVHAPFAGINISLPSRPLLNATLKRLKGSIVNSSALDCQMWVFHPGMRTGISAFYPSSDWARNLESVRSLMEFARDHGVKASIENVMELFVMKDVEEFKRFYSEVNENVGLAFDTGHANLIGQVESFLTEFPDKIVHVHAHDNHGKRDQHLGIGYGNINWEKFASLLKKAPRDKIVIVESVEHIEESMRKLKHLLA
jgi:sugar phosphate isomerase/epimerase